MTKCMERRRETLRGKPSQFPLHDVYLLSMLIAEFRRDRCDM